MWDFPFSLSTGGPCRLTYSGWADRAPLGAAPAARRLPMHRWVYVPVLGQILASAFVSDLGLRFPCSASSGFGAR